VQTLRQLEHLVDRGLIIAGDDAGIALYRLTPMGSRPETLDPSRRVLVVEDDLALGELFVEMLDQEGYAVIGAGTLIEVTALLTHVSFDLAITDGFSQSPQAVLTSARESRAAVVCHRRHLAPACRPRHHARRACPRT
jgi:hypothetical protein